MTIEDESTLEAIAYLIHARGYQSVTTLVPYGIGNIPKTVWSTSRKTLDLDWYKLTEKFGDTWIYQLNALLNTH